MQPLDQKSPRQPGYRPRMIEGRQRIESGQYARCAGRLKDSLNQRQTPPQPATAGYLLIFYRRLYPDLRRRQALFNPARRIRRSGALLVHQSE